MSTDDITKNSNDNNVANRKENISFNINLFLEFNILFDDN